MCETHRSREEERGVRERNRKWKAKGYFNHTWKLNSQGLTDGRKQICGHLVSISSSVIQGTYAFMIAGFPSLLRLLDQPCVCRTHPPWLLIPHFTPPYFQLKRIQRNTFLLFTFGCVSSISFDLFLSYLFVTVFYTYNTLTSSSNIPWSLRNMSLIHVRLFVTP